MVLDAKMQQVQAHFGISTLDHWRTIKPAWITGIHGIGNSTLNQIRLELALKGITLEGDRTPEYWKAKLGTVRAGQVMADAETRIVCPFVVLVDSMEQQPFSFAGIQVDRSNWTADIRWRVEQGLTQPGEVTYEVPIEWKGLGIGRGDYSIQGHEGHCHIERKSISDAAATVLGWGRRRERFEAELEWLASIDTAAVVIEGSYGVVMADIQQRGRKTVDENRKTFFRQVLAYQQDYRVPWMFADSRRMAELMTFRVMERHWRKQAERTKQAAPKAERARQLIDEL